jgi:putative nucleotidyltransferase with HDIG domain
MKAPVIDAIMENVKAFPGMPGAASKLLVLLENPDVAASELEAVLRYDPGLTANILRLANSAYFGLSTRIASIHHGVVILGAQQLKKLVLTSCMNAVLDEQVCGYDLPAGELWAHSVAVTVAAEGLASELALPDTESVFTAALLHDVGKLILGDYVDHQLPLIEEKAAEGLPFHDAERVVLGTDHAEIGAHILRKWAFPEPLVAAVRWHHDPEQASGHDPLVDLVHLANVLALMIGVGLGRAGLHCQLSTSAADRLGLKSHVLEKVASKTLEWVSELNDVFTTETVEG